MTILVSIIRIENDKKGYIMEFITFFIIIAIGSALYGTFEENKKKTDPLKSNVRSSNFSYPAKTEPVSRQKSQKNNTIVYDAECEIVEEEKHVVNNYYIQNNIYIQNNDNSSSKSKGHTARIWERKGYRVKYGETYAYKHYGNEVFTEDQVIKITNDSYIENKKYISEKKKSRKSRESETHTYDEWLELGYQVRRGERAISSSRRRYYFDREQVAWVG